MSTHLKRWLWRLSAAVTVLSVAAPAWAVPSFARQTGQDCVACHIGGYGPQLTPYGIRFKLGGYTDSDGKGGKVPLSGMVVASYNQFKNDDGKDTSKTRMSEASIFLAGRLTDQIGAFVQATHDGIERHSAIDQADIRYATPLTLYGKDAILGVSVNNNPTVQDPFNTLPVWSFPYTSSPYGNAMGAEFQGLGGVEQRVMGTSAYAFVDNRWYGELGLYNTISPGVQSRLGLGHADGQELGRLRNAPYWRLGYMRDLRTQAFSVGLFGFDGTLKDRSSGDRLARFKDLGVDASYQFLGTREHVATVNTSYIRERSTDAEGARNTQRDWRLSTSYHFQNTYGGTIGYFRGTSANGEAGNRGMLYQLDWTPWGKESSWMSPWANLRVGLQYVAYRRYVQGTTDEATGETSYAPVGRPRDKNTVSVFAWTSF
ncbi:hypothetical protein [uncultured Aquabacterium sp.]|uniref:hypothetical protein n=1 Tax=Aquabacterium sp. TaxID=1872578 RepID=UPI0025F63492|nr:hypothetical protein [uncultured Aquabacterium sp.]